MKTALAVGGTMLAALAAYALVSAFQKHVAAIPVAGAYLPK